MLTYNDVLDAQKRISGYIFRTPLLRVSALDEYLGCRVYIKPENLQKTGSFKMRGATNALLSLTDEERARGIVACSSGNHAKAVAYASSLLGVDAVIVMPEDVNPMKLEGTKAYGATAVLAGTLASERDAKAREIMEKEGRPLIHPYANENVEAGQGTMALEILEDEPDMDVIVAPIGGGGMISGVSTAAKGKKPGIRVIGTEPTGAPRYRLSREAGKPLLLDHVETIADGTRTDHAEPNNFKIIEKLVDDLISVTDDEIRAAMKLTIEKAKIVAEPSSSMPVAAALAGKLPVSKDDKVCFIVSGGNNDLKLLKEIL